MNTHGAVVNRIAWMAATYGLGAGDVMLQKTPSAFDVSVWEMFWPLVRARHWPSRVRTVIATRGLLALIERYGVTRCSSLPRCWSRSWRSPIATPRRSLRRVICGGEALPPALARVHARFPPVSLINCTDRPRRPGP